MTISNRIWSSVIVGLLAATLIAPSVAGKAADVDGADFLMWRVWKSSAKALLVIRETDQGAEVSFGLRGLPAGTGFRLIGTNANGDCASPVTDANRTFGYQNEYAGGASYDLFRFMGPTGIAESTRFIRVREIGGGQWVCGSVNRGEEGPNPGDFASASYGFSDGPLEIIVVAQRLSGDRARVSLAFGDADGDADIDGQDLAVFSKSKACSRSGGTTPFWIRLENVVNGAFATREVNMNQSAFDSVRSIRVRTLTGNSDTDWFFKACGRSFVTDLIIDP